MQKQILAAVVASVVAGQAMAVTVVDDGTNTVTVGGHVGMRYVDQDKGDTAGDSSRINFGFEHMLTQDTTAFAKVEWGFDVTNTGTAAKDSNDEIYTDNNVFNNRLGYVGAMNEQFGTVTFGKQWSSYSMVAGWTDMFATTGGSASGMYSELGDKVGTARADDALQYSYSMMGLNISAQTQLGERNVELPSTPATTGTRDGSYSFAASYDLPMGLSIGAAYNQAEIDNAKVGGTDVNDFKAKAAVIGAKFEADKIYAAFTYAKLDNLGDDYLGVVEEAEGIELYASYQLNDMFKIGGGYNQLKDESSYDAPHDKGEIKYFPIEVVYTQGPVQLSGTYQFEDSEMAESDVKVEDKLILQARYYF